MPEPRNALGELGRQPEPHDRPTSGVLAVIPARGGSKGIPRKNLRLLGGHPLVAWALAAGLQASQVTRVVCSTDDDEIASVAADYGAEVPFLRPAELAADDTPDLPVFRHLLAWLAAEQGWEPELVVHLRPTTPLRPAGLVDQAIELLRRDTEATSVRAVCPAPATPYKMWLLPEEGDAGERFMRPLLDVDGIAEPYNTPRQSLPQAWWQIGTVDVIRSEVIGGGSMTGPRILPVRLEKELAIDIDEPSDLLQAEMALAKTQCVRPGPSIDWSAIALLVVDIDGTMTDGVISYDLDGEAFKDFHTHDGKGISMVMASGVEVMVVTQEKTAFASARARKLQIPEVHVGIEDKLALLDEIVKQRQLGLRNVAYVGDDLGDRDAMLAVAAAGGAACAVSDARPEVLAAANFVCRCAGGRGAVRDVCDQILEHRG
jgi:YrbI family 3-deoxy-D-manno-octulosonate 8-phosphate phosphatase